MRDFLVGKSNEEVLLIYKKNKGNRERRGSFGHPANEIYFCDKCDLKFRTKEAFRSHQKVHKIWRRER